jgi:hypothetical protein
MSPAIDAVTVMRHFLLCNAMQAGPFSPESDALVAIAAKRAHISAMSDAEVVAAAENPHRRSYYLKAQWNLVDVDLRNCYVWKEMGGRPWATGTVDSLLPIYRQQEPKNSRIWAMVPHAGLFADHLRIVIIREKGMLNIDDGSHRAMAMALGGLSSAHAFVGNI